MWWRGWIPSDRLWIPCSHTCWKENRRAFSKREVEHVRVINLDAGNTSKTQVIISVIMNSTKERRVYGGRYSLRILFTRGWRVCWVHSPRQPPGWMNFKESEAPPQQMSILVNHSFHLLKVPHTVHQLQNVWKGFRFLVVGGALCRLRWSDTQTTDCICRRRPTSVECLCSAESQYLPDQVQTRANKHNFFLLSSFMILTILTASADIVFNSL